MKKGPKKVYPKIQQLIPIGLNLLRQTRKQKIKNKMYVIRHKNG